jgi:1-phosphofructokinase family hexose kinase
MIVTVTPNPAIDLTTRVDHVLWGESNRVPIATRRAGGKGVNVSRVLAQMRRPTVAVAAVGQHDLDFFMRDLADVPHRLVPVADFVTRHSHAIVEQTSPTRVTLFNELGMPMPDDAWASVMREVAAAAAVRCVVVSGSTPPRFSAERLRMLLSTAVESGVPVVADVSGVDLLTAAECGVTLLKPNRRELCEATGEHDVVLAARSLLVRGAHAVVVSLGEDGMMLLRRGDDRVVTAVGPRLDGNPTGAGDAAVASLADHLADGVDDAETLLRRAVAWSAASVGSPLAGEVGPDLESIRDAVHIDDVRSLS